MSQGEVKGDKQEVFTQERKKNGQVRFEDNEPDAQQRSSSQRLSKVQKHQKNDERSDISHDDRPWSFSVTLSLGIDTGAHDELWLIFADGGGIRGYWQLLVLQRLMEEIAKTETTSEAKANSSLHPLKPEIPTTQQDSSDSTDAFLPCHYFDFIGGSSTGG
jgi:hypothetical protein